MCSPGETADQEGLFFSLSSSLSRTRLCPFSKHIPIVLRCAMCSCFPFPGPQLLQPRISRLSGQQQQRPNKTFCPQRDTLSSEFRGLLALFVRCKSGPQGKKTASCVWSEPSVSDCEYATIKRRVTRRSCSKDEAAGMLEDVGVPCKICESHVEARHRACKFTHRESSCTRTAWARLLG